jgi:competence protein ComEC
MPNPFIDIISKVLPEPQAGLLNGILFGLRANLPKDFYQSLITTGTIHMIALSGQNISILTSIVAKLTIPLGRKISSIISVLSISGFVIFVGLEPSIIRAAIMGSLSLFAIYFGRQNWSLLGLILAAGLMLIIHPAWIRDVSFQLSFLATLGIILVGGAKYNKPKSAGEEIIRELNVNLRTTLAAQLFTLPIILTRFGRISIIAPITNVLIGWTISPIMILGFILSLVGWLYLPLAMIVGWMVWVPLTFIIQIIEFTAKLPFAEIKF